MIKPPGFDWAAAPFIRKIELAGDVHDKSLLHLQCNCGQDTLSFAQLGAAVTGVDISSAAIQTAGSSRTTRASGTFIRSDIYDWLEAAGAGPDRFDIVFSSYGAICWLSDLATWARGIAGVLEPG
ncbi:MAG: methyltransferase domain-containing protein [Thermomicrobiales bacterium]